ncbi:MAG TPA: hypothetical protein VIS06_04280 [Mycobacteriales bacterium]
MRTSREASLGGRGQHSGARDLALAMSAPAAAVLGFGLGMVVGMPLVVVVTSLWYEKVWLPRIAGDED